MITELAEKSDTTAALKDVFYIETEQEYAAVKKMLASAAEQMREELSRYAAALTQHGVSTASIITEELETAMKTIAAAEDIALDYQNRRDQGAMAALDNA